MVLLERHEDIRFLPCTFLCGCILLFATYCCAQSPYMSLDQNWQFRKAGDSIWYSADVPGTVHTDLMKHDLIPDPFFRDNESKVQWIEEEAWEYQTVFSCEKNLLESKKIEIRFDGL